VAQNTKKESRMNEEERERRRVEEYRAARLVRVWEMATKEFGEVNYSTVRRAVGFVQELAEQDGRDWDEDNAVRLIGLLRQEWVYGLRVGRG